MTDPDSDLEEDARKRAIAIEITNRANNVLSIQIVNEVCAVLKRKANFTENQLRQLIGEFYIACTISGVNRRTVGLASELRERYRFSYWDSLIVGSTLLSNVSTLYSEDMQDGLVVDNRLKIVNPFK